MQFLKYITKNATKSCRYPFLFYTASNVMKLPLYILGQLANDLFKFNCRKYYDTENKNYRIAYSDKNNFHNFMIVTALKYIIS